MKYYGHFLIKDGKICHEKLLDGAAMGRHVSGVTVWEYIQSRYEGKRAIELSSEYAHAPDDAVLYYAEVEIDD